MAQFASNLEKKHTGRKRPTKAIRLGFLIEIFIRKIIFSGLLSGFPYNLIFLLAAFPHTVFGAPVGLLFSFGVAQGQKGKG